MASLVGFVLIQFMKHSGMDNSPRWDKRHVTGLPYTMDNIDFSVYASREMYYLSLIAEELSDTDKVFFLV